VSVEREASPALPGTSAPPTDAPVIAARGLWKYFGDRPALRGLDLELERGGFLTVFGPNGAGKTTLIRVLSTQLQPSEGQALVAGLDVVEGAQELRRRVGVISHATYLYDHLTALENLLFYGRMYKVADCRDRATALLEEVGLTGRADDRVGGYSRGMQQRLSIARALLHEPEILFLDEPYSGLDQHACRMLLGVLETLRGGGRSLVMTTHNLEQGLALCDEVAIQVRGRIVYREREQAIDHLRFAETYFAHVGQGNRWDS
jgi:ABC-type multidrug transport system ATPase subunit